MPQSWDVNSIQPREKAASFADYNQLKINIH